ncbi:hypothetical protein CRV08_12355 [Halarcobacter ebronensis]|uniref:Nucleotidyl transferase domain-containing protein n=1 Tax=Halarcobacter ebronensis TaxID=1462615 RepID=A0A4Q0YAQ9_9BACT|nr:nucleotidyltransferase family protein [Halarcobacter ebronensis]RXJ66614.1 hypothetical protein CRV08_12355 [Halarcobacter ebronensis]
MKALLLAAGFGTRLRPLTNNIPKCLVPINGKALLEIWLENLIEAGIKEFLINTHYLHKEVEAFVANSKYKDYITLTYEEELLGTAGTLIKNKDFFKQNEPFMVIHADNLCICDFKDFISSHYLREVKNTLMTMMLFRTDTPEKCGIVELDTQNIVKEFYEKPRFPSSNLANAAIYIFEYDIFNLIDNINHKNPDISIDLIPLLLGKINTYENKTLNIDIGTPNSYKNAQKLYIKHFENNKYTFLKKYFSIKQNFDFYKHRSTDIKNRLLKQKEVRYKNKRLLVICDFIDIPCTFELINIYMIAEVIRRKYDLEKFDLIFISHAKDPSTNRNKFITPENRRQYILNLALENSLLFEHTGSLFVFDNRNQFIDFYKNVKKAYKYIYPKNYDYKLPIDIILNRVGSYHSGNLFEYLKKDTSLLSLKPPKDKVIFARKWIKNFIYPKIPITITIREIDFNETSRNTNIEHWQKLVDYFKNDKYIFIIFRDYNNLYEKDFPITGENVKYLNEAVISNSFRSALYQEVTLNLFVSNGTAMLAIANEKTRYIIFNFYNPLAPSTSIEHLKNALFLYYKDSFHGSTKYQKLIWEKDSFDTLKSYTIEMLDLIKHDLGLEPLFYTYTDDEISSMVEKKDIEVDYKNIESPIDKNLPTKEYKLFFNLQRYINFIKQKYINPIKQKYKYLLFKIKNISLFHSCYLYIKINKLYLLQKYEVRPTKILFKKRNYYLENLIYSIKNENKNIIIYGAGSIGEALYPILKDNIILYIDSSGVFLNKNSKIQKDVFKPNILNEKNLNYDYIIITPKYREIEIAKDLMNLYKIPDNKILIF